MIVALTFTADDSARFNIFGDRKAAMAARPPQNSDQSIRNATSATKLDMQYAALTVKRAELIILTV